MEEYPDFIVTIDGDEYDCHPVCRQPYQDCYFEAGFIDNYPKDPMYLLLSREGNETFIYLRPDEIAAIAWVINGLLWTDAMNGGATTLLQMLADERRKSELLQAKLQENKGG